MPALRAVPAQAWTVERLGGLSNRNYRLREHRGGTDLVVRLAGSGSDAFVSRRTERKNLLAAAAAGLAPEALHADPETGTLVTRFAGTALDETAAADGAALAAAGRLLARLHGSGLEFGGAIEPFAAIDRYLAVAPDAELEARRRAAETARGELLALAEPARPCHVDPGPANFVRTPAGGLVLIDWEFSAMADPAWDLAALAVEWGLDRAGEDAVLAAYGGAGDPRRRRKLDLMRPLIHLVAATWASAVLGRGAAARDIGPVLVRHRRALARLAG